MFTGGFSLFSPNFQISANSDTVIWMWTLAHLACWSHTVKTDHVLWFLRRIFDVFEYVARLCFMNGFFGNTFDYSFTFFGRCTKIRQRLIWKTMIIFIYVDDYA